MLELPEFVPGLATLNCTSIDMGRSIWHPVGLTMTPSTNRSTVQLKMRLPALGVKFRAAKAWMNVKSAVPPSRRPVGKPFLACAAGSASGKQHHGYKSSHHPAAAPYALSAAACDLPCTHRRVGTCAPFCVLSLLHVPYLLPVLPIPPRSS